VVGAKGEYPIKARTAGSDSDPWKRISSGGGLPLAKARSHGPYLPAHAALSAPLASNH